MFDYWISKKTEILAPVVCFHYTLISSNSAYKLKSDQIVALSFGNLKNEE